MEPEFTGYHPGVIIRGASSLDLVTQTVSFVPLTTKAQRADPKTGKLPPYIYQLSTNPNPRTKDPCWAICNHITTVRLTRLERYIGDAEVFIPKVSKEDFSNIVQAIRRGFGVLENHIKAIVEQEKAAYKAALDAEHEARVAALEAEISNQAAERALQMLDEMTKPAQAAS